MTDRKKPGVTFWATVVLVAAVLYVLSSGPADWLIVHDSLPEWADDALRAFYSPLAFLHDYGPDYWRSAMYWYTSLWID